MAFTAPRTWINGELETAEIFNLHLRDNLLETAPARVTTAGDQVYATGPNALARLPIGAAGTRLESDGGAPVWRNPKGCFVYLTADEAVASGTEKKIPWDAELFDDLGAWTSGGDLTLPTPGWYLAHGQIRWIGAITSNLRLAEQNVQADPVLTQYTRAATAASEYQQVLGLFYVTNAPRTMALYVAQSSGSSQTLEAGEFGNLDTWLSVVRL